MSDEIRVLYNARCPVCRTEIDHYAAHTRARNLPIRFDDLNSADIADWGISADQAARRLHVFKDGEIYSGINGFLVLWQGMPRWRALATLVALPGVRGLATALYDRALAPALYRRHLARTAHARGASAARR